MKSKPNTSRVEVLLRADKAPGIGVWGDVHPDLYTFGTTGPLVEFADLFRVFEFYRDPANAGSMRRPMQHGDVVLVCARASAMAHAYVFIPRAGNTAKNILSSVKPMPFEFMEDELGLVKDTLLYKHIITSSFRSHLVK